MTRRYITAKEQSEIIERAQGRCEYCQSWMSYATQSFVFEHIIPVSRGGETNEDFTHIIGLTPTGRATVYALKMNRPGLINMRQLLRVAGNHPPDFGEDLES